MDNSDIKASIDAKREERRRRILENSNKRLEKITGRTFDEIIVNSVPEPAIIYPDPELEQETYEPLLLNNHFMTAQQNQKNLFQNGFQEAFLQQNLSNQQSNNHLKTQNVTLIKKILETKLLIILMSIFVYFLFETNNEFCISYNIFFPLLLWEVVEVYLLKTYENKNSVLNIVFLLAGIPQNYSQILFKIFGTLNKVFKDVAVFIFFFVITHILWQRYLFVEDVIMPSAKNDYNDNVVVM